MGHRRRRRRGLSPAVHVRQDMDRWRRGNTRWLERLLLLLKGLLLKRGDHWVRARLLGREGVRLEGAIDRANRVFRTSTSTAGHGNVRTTCGRARNTKFFSRGADG